ncbi:hypothetical protein GCQ56_01185 [Marinifilum sp. N1E240]|uniref:hypothetical protein n=1 Tax=Marinifilum sp. N1E240 TaxID=2608082 RepID=UPI00128DE06A|nr:hypothetical protein [Marinifilum sp. N1E240]MPQ45607.1 hypothetical protein [Marinifilum sp. N1E240]
MDEGWGNIIYLLLLALFGVFGALKKKKPVAVSPPDEEEYEQPIQPVRPKQSEDNSFDSVFEALLGQEIPKPYEQTYDEIEELPIKEEIVETTPEVKEVSIEYSDQPKKSVFDDLRKNYEEEDEAEEAEEVDWRQAIIYKEILDRKYQ